MCSRNIATLILIKASMNGKKNLCSMEKQEKEIARLHNEGLSNRAIARETWNVGKARSAVAYAGNWKRKQRKMGGVSPVPLVGLYRTDRPWLLSFPVRAW